MFLAPMRDQPNPLRFIPLVRSSKFFVCPSLKDEEMESEETLYGMEGNDIHRLRAARTLVQ